MNSIILLGFRYTGKSTIGKSIAKVNNLEFIDLDKEIEKKAGKNAKEITKNGKDWSEFRKIEFELFQYYLKKKNIVLSCGGGVCVNDFFGSEERKLLENNDNFLKILLEIEDKEILEREKTSENRPLVNGLNSIDLFKERKNLYESIDFDLKIDSSLKNISFSIENGNLSAVIGDPIWHSLSPKIHNSLYNDLKISDIFTYTKIQIKHEKIHKIKEIISTLNLKGISITSPYKEEILKYLDEIDDFSRKISAVNTVLNKNGKLYGFNTDCIGVKNALMNSSILDEKKIAIFGSGGGAKSAVIGLIGSTKNITMFNRTKEKNDEFCLKNEIKSLKINDFDPKDFDIIINATTVGLNSNESILDQSKILKNHTVFDMVYNPLQTKLIKIAKKQGARIIYGTEMLIYQAIEQFEIYTQLKADIDIARKSIKETNSNKICIVVSGKTINNFIKNLKKAQKLSNFIELRVDYIENLSFKDIDKIAKIINKDAIFTCRMKKDGGNFSGTIEKNKKIMKYAIELNKFSYFDIDLQNSKEYKDLFLSRNNWKLIISYHNFEKSISYEDYNSILNDIEAMNPDLRKIASIINTSDDLIDMIKFIKKNNKEDNLIFAPMSDNKILRLIALDLGSWTNFFCLNEKFKTSKGQISFQEYSKIKDILF